MIDRKRFEELCSVCWYNQDYAIAKEMLDTIDALLKVKEAAEKVKMIRDDEEGVYLVGFNELQAALAEANKNGE